MVSSIISSDIVVVLFLNVVESAEPLASFVEVVRCCNETSSGFLGERLRFFVFRRLLGAVIRPFFPNRHWR
jgi:hypothetical protein